MPSNKTEITNVIVLENALKWKVLFYAKFLGKQYLQMIVLSILQTMIIK